MNKKRKIFAILMALPVLAAACAGANGNGQEDLTASGTISTRIVEIAPELGGMVASIKVEEGHPVQAGQVLFTIDDAIFQAQYDQAAAALESAQVALAAAEVQSKSVNFQYQAALQNARVQFADALENEQRKDLPADFDLPAWYFTRAEEIEIAKEMVEESAEELGQKADALEAELEKIVNRDFIALEKELETARSTYLIADAALEAAQRADDNEELEEAAQDAFDLRETELENIQKQYDQALDAEMAEDVRQARGKLGAAQATYDQAVDLLNTYFIGDDALAVQLAETAVELASSQADQAQAASKQAQAALRTAEIQLEKTSVSSPESGLILVKNVEVGELVGAGSVVMTVGNLDEVQLTVYIPEDQYGRIQLDQEVSIHVDSFPEQDFLGTVTYIADQAEFTPSNVQTTEGRKSTVFAVEISIPNPALELKPGMPADVIFLFE